MKTHKLYNAYRTIILFMFLSWAVLFVPGTAFGATYYVDFMNGSDNNNGLSTAAPWKHCPGDANAAGNPSTTTAAAGDTIFFKGGVEYNGTINVSSSRYNNGTSGNLIVIKSGHLRNPQWGTTRAIIDGETTVRGKGFSVNRSYIRIEGFEIRDMKNETDSSGIFVTGSSTYCELINNLIHHIYGARGASGYGIEITGSVEDAYHLIEKNEIYYVEEKAIELYRQGSSTVRYNYLHESNDHLMVVSSKYNKIYDNIFEQAGYDWDGGGAIRPSFGFKFDGSSSVSASYNEFYNNIIYDCNSALAIMDNANNNKYYNNTIYYTGFDDLYSDGGQEMCGIVMSGTGGGTVHSNLIKNNIFLYNNIWSSQYRVGISIRDGIGDNNVFSNNLFYQANTARVRDSGTNYYLTMSEFADGSGNSHRFEAHGSGNSFDGNTTYEVEPDFKGGTYYDLINSGTLPDGFNSNWIPNKNGLKLTYLSQDVVKTGGANLSSTFDVDIEGSKRINWSIGAYEYGGIPLGIDEEYIEIKGALNIPKVYALYQNYPNPFNPETTIKFVLPKVSDVMLKIYNILSQEVRTIVNERKEAGYYSIKWDSRNNNGILVSSGIYLYRIKAGNFVMTRKMLVVR